MTNSTADLVVRALVSPEALPEQSLQQWDLLIRQARRADLLPRIADLLDKLGRLPDVPAAPRAHLTAALVLAEAQRNSVLREISHVRHALGAIGQQALLLKGSAYLAAGLPAARGRIFTDIDILVPKTALPEVEAVLMQGGWATTHHHPYDQRYYREWMHELPPFQHIRRGTVLDVHHAILPETARLKPDSSKLISASQALSDHPGVRVLSPPDMVLHSMAHLFFNEELSHGLRDLSDLDLLLRYFAPQPGFWQSLLTRAVELSLSRPLFYGLRYTAMILRTPIPNDVCEQSKKDAPSPMVLRLMDALWKRALRAPHPSAADRFGPLALKSLYVRAHWLRMPPLLLVRHLVTKSLITSA
ncbi:MAG: nucleotidyltransferase family protein [Betaproteobacteria bacterium]